MDDLDHKIIRLMMKNARMPVKDIAEQVNLTSPAVSSRIHRLETDGVIGGYTVVLHPPEDSARVQALISIAANPTSRADFLSQVENEPQVLQCYRVTGSYNFILKVSCANIDSLEHLLTKFQKMGSTNTQIILATQLDRPLMY
ncbi:MAG: Lrp/AsnC family transcriptional regulator [Gemmiger sp.]|nr:Lrp/AsnC family transcriptional regulator [Gemmiger sp.]